MGQERAGKGWDMGQERAGIGWDRADMGQERAGRRLIWVRKALT